MNFECLPNEILLDLFDYFDDVNILYTFYGLNSRFNHLFHRQFRKCHINFKTISKRIFNQICQQHLPLILNHISSLTLSDGEETPEQIDLFFSYFPSFSTFIQLQSLTLDDLHSCERILIITEKCKSLPNLTRLKFNSCYIEDNSIEAKFIINNIWSLPKLTHCDLPVLGEIWPYFSTSTKISTSLRRLCIRQCHFDCYRIYQWFHHTPYLSQLEISIRFNNANCYYFNQFLSLITLKICIFSECDISKLKLFFQNTPNLRNLIINLDEKVIDGQQWKEIIETYLTKLKTFRLKMKDKSYHYSITEEQPYRLIDSFRDPFWIIKYQLFVRCIVQDDTIYLYTLPNTIKYDNPTIPRLCLSTYPYDNQKWFCDGITTIDDKTFFNRPIQSDIQLSNIQHLRIQFPIHRQFSSVVSSLKRLDTLSILHYNDEYQSQLQDILDRATQLRCLHIHQSSSLPLQTSIFKYRNPSLRRFLLENYSYYFNEEECQRLSYSPLAKQVEVLSVMVKHPHSVVYLIEKLLNLRLLNIRYERDKYDEQFTTTKTNDQFVHSLINILPTTCSVARAPNSPGRIRIWL